MVATPPEFTSMRREREPGVGQVERDACRTIDGEAQRLGRRPVEPQPQLQLLSGQCLHVDRLELQPVGGLCRGETGQRCSQ
jgi:hypothetical protein